VYSSAFYGFEEYFWYLNEFPADQIAWRTWNGGAWGYDEAEKFVLSTQTWNSESKIIKDAWTHAWETIGLCNTLINDLNKINPEAIGMTQEKVNSRIAEVRTLRAWAYYNNFELWGGTLPLCVEADGNIPGSADADFNTGCQVIWQFIADELDACVDDMVAEDGSNNTRNMLNKGVNRMLKMRLLLNSQIWTGTDRFNECAKLCEEIINGDYGQYNLAADYREIYGINNNTCPEVVFAFAQEAGRMTNNNRVTPFMPYNYDEMFGFSCDQGGWNCTCLVPSKDNYGAVVPNAGSDAGRSFIFYYGDKLGAPYDRMNDKDIRKQPFQCDAAGNWKGMFAMGAQINYNTGEPVLADADLQDKPLIYVDQVGTFLNLGRELEVVMSPRWGQTNSGFRPVKYPVYPASVGVDWRDADEVEFRLAEVYYTLAECRLRAGNTEAAKQ
ncbi:MAG: RagB/SusD family nutrient uptake outer membrane protein, partial [Muribaculaceae bacterium]|nr:RagB/SusD family nutrient uptake outer membrane protein [Muribaculaceae bacterium]